MIRVANFDLRIMRSHHHAMNQTVWILSLAGSKADL